MAIAVVEADDLGVRPPCFSDDKRRLFVCSGRVVRGVSTVTGQLALELRGHEDDVTGVHVHPVHRRRLVTASLDGTIRVWDADDGDCLGIYDVGAPVTHFAPGTRAKGGALVVVIDSRGFRDREPYPLGHEVHVHQLGRDRADLPAIRVLHVELEALGSAAAVADDRASAARADVVLPSTRGVCTGLLWRPDAGSLPRAHASALEDGVRVLGLTGAAAAATISALASSSSSSSSSSFSSSSSSSSSVSSGRAVWAIGKELFLWRPGEEAPRRVVHTKPITALEFHPSEDLLALGDLEGQLWLLKNSASAVPPSAMTVPVPLHTLPTSMKHWHAHAISALRFSDDGATIFSGGDEATLVAWQLRADTRSFLPRLGAPVRWIATSRGEGDLPPVHALGLGDNSVRLVNATSNRDVWQLRSLAIAPLGHLPWRARDAAASAATGGAGVRGTVRLRLAQRSALAQRAGRTLKPGLQVDPRSGAVVVNGYPGRPCLQFFDAHRLRHLIDVEVHPRNSTVRVDLGGAPEVRIEHAAFSGDGTGLVTVEVASDPSGRPVSALKFWSFSSARQQFVLTSQVESPHKGPVTAIDYHPTGHVVFTSSHRRAFKIWCRQDREPSKETIAQRDLRRRAEDASGGGGGGSGSGEASSSSASSSGGVGAGSTAEEPRVAWSCRSLGFYRDEEITAGCFSGDGSLLAVAFGHVVTLWVPMSNRLRGTLSHSSAESPYRALAFPGLAPFLVAATEHEIQVWDLLACRIRWACGSKLVDAAGRHVRVEALAAERSSATEISAGSALPIGFFAAVLTSSASTTDSDTLVSLWDVSDPTPAHVWSLTAALAAGESVAAIQFLRRPSATTVVSGGAGAGGPLAAAERLRGLELVAITSHNRLLILRPTATTASPTGSTSSSSSGAATAALAADREALATASATPLGRWLSVHGGSVTPTALAAVRSAAASNRGGRTAESAFFEGPVHTLPAISTFASLVLRAGCDAPTSLNALLGSAAPSMSSSSSSSSDAILPLGEGTPLPHLDWASGGGGGGGSVDLSADARKRRRSSVGSIESGVSGGVAPAETLAAALVASAKHWFAGEPSSATTDSSASASASPSASKRAAVLGEEDGARWGLGPGSAVGPGSSSVATGVAGSERKLVDFFSRSLFGSK